MSAPTEFLSVFLISGVLWSLGLAAVSLGRLMSQPSPLERIMMVDFLNLLMVAILLLGARLFESVYFLDAAVVLTMLSFAGTLGAVRYLLNGRLFCAGAPFFTLAAISGTVASQPDAAATATWSVWLSTALIVAALLILTIGVIGINRLPDFYTRVHAASKAGMVGVALLAGSLLQTGDHAIVLRGVLVLFFLAITSPISAHALLRTAILRQEQLWPPSIDGRREISESGAEE